MNLRRGLGHEGTNASAWWPYCRNGIIRGQYSRITADWGLMGALDAQGVPVKCDFPTRSLLLPSYGSDNIIYIYRRPPTVAPEQHPAWVAAFAKRLCEQADPGSIQYIEPLNEVSYAWYPPCTVAKPGWPDYRMFATWMVECLARTRDAVAPFGVKLIGPTIGTSLSTPEVEAFLAADGLQYVEQFAFHDYGDQAAYLANVKAKIEFYRRILPVGFPLINSECGFSDAICTPAGIAEYVAFHRANGVGLIGHQWTADNNTGNPLHGYWQPGGLTPTAKLSAILDAWPATAAPVPAAGTAPCHAEPCRYVAPAAPLPATLCGFKPAPTTFKLSGTINRNTITGTLTAG